MALETLAGVESIGGYKVTRTGQGNDFIGIMDDDNAIAFKLQKGPIKEVGVNGCQVDTMIEAAKLIIEGLNKKFPCRENYLAIAKLEGALLWLYARTEGREARGVEGTSET